MMVLKNLMFAGLVSAFGAGDEPPPSAAPPGEAAGEPSAGSVDDPGTTPATPPTTADPATSDPATASDAPATTEPTTSAAGPADPGGAAGTGASATGPEQAEPPPNVGNAEPPGVDSRGRGTNSGRGTGKDKSKRKAKSRSHLKTGGIAVAPGIGFGLRTAGDKFCGQFSSDNADQDGRRALCTGATPWVMDFTAMYGVFERLDISLGLRLNLQPRSFRNDECPSDNPICDRGQGLFNNTLGVGIMPGVRIWGGEVDKIVKMGGAIDFLYMYESFAGYRNRPLAADEDDDSQPSEDGVGDHMLGLRAGPILQIDPHHNVGIYLIPAAVPSFRPARDGFDQAGWFEIAFEATLGVQGRFP